MLFFTDWVSDLEVRYMYGWSMIVIMCLNIFVNMIFIIYYAVKNTIALLKWAVYYLK